MLATWVAFPAALALLSAGCGLLLDRLAGRSLPGALVVPAGFAVVLTTVGLLTASTALARFSLVVLVVLALVGGVLGLARLRPLRIDRWALAVGLAVFLVYGAPAYLSGTPTFSGSLVLPDTSNQLVLAQRLSHAGPDYESLAPSSYAVSAQKYLYSQYPVAAQATLGVVAPAGLHQIAWVYQPFLSFMAAMTALALYALIGRLVRRRRVRALVAFVSAQPALAYSYTLQGSIKEVAGIATFWLMAALVGDALEERTPTRGLLPTAVAAAAMLGVLGPAALVYLAPLVLALGVGWLVQLVRAPRIRELGWAVVVVALVAVLAYPVLSGAQTAYTVNKAVLSMKEDLGNLAAPLQTFQALGVWLGTDFRYSAEHIGLTRVLAVAMGICALIGVGFAARRRAVGPLLGVVSLALVSAYLVRKGSPYADGKVLMVLSPALVLAAALGAVAIGSTRRRRLRPVGVVVGLVVGVGVLASNALAYYGVQNAPYDRYSELLHIDQRFSGQGPALFTEYDEYSGYLLRDVRPWAAPEYPLVFRDHDPARDPNGLVDPDHRPSVKSPIDVEDLTGAFVQSVPLIVQRRSPTMSRPPADFEPVYRGRYYEVWRRSRDTRVVRHLALGRNLFAPAGVPSCAQVARLAARARQVGGRLAYVERPALVVSDPLRADRPRTWFSYAAYPRAVVPNGPGRVRDSVRLPAGGVYRLWLEGSFGRPVRVDIDGRRVGSVAREAGNAGSYHALATLRLAPGRHTITITRAGRGLHPGDGGGAQASLRHLGPIVFSPPANERPAVRTVAPAGARGLCGRRLDWIEVVTGRPPAAG